MAKCDKFEAIDEFLASSFECLCELMPAIKNNDEDDVRYFLYLLSCVNLKDANFPSSHQQKLDKNLMGCNELVLLKIINKLPRNDLVTLAEVNKRLNEHAEYSFRLHHRNFANSQSTNSTDCHIS